MYDYTRTLPVLERIKDELREDFDLDIEDSTLDEETMVVVGDDTGSNILAYSPVLDRLMNHFGLDEKEEKWIQKAINPAEKGELRKKLGAKEGENIPAKKLAKAAKMKGETGQQARLAQTLKKMKKKGK